MTAIWTVKDANYSTNATRFNAPITTGLKGWWYLGGTQELSERNLAFNGNASLVGSPTIEDGYVSFAGYSSGQWMQTTLGETASDTLLVVMRSSDTFASGATRPAPIGNWSADPGNSNTVHGSTILVLSTVGAPSAQLVGAQSHDVTGTLTAHLSGQITVADLSGWKFLAKSFNDTTNEKVFRNVTNAQSTSSSTTNTRELHTTSTHRIGGGYTSSYSGACDVAFAAIYDAGLTTGQIDDIYDFVARFLLDRRGITI